MSGPLSSRPCPLCGSGEKDVLFHQSFSAAVDGNFLEGYDVAVCLACGFGYADGLPGQDDFDRYYREASKYENEHRGGEGSVEDLERFRAIADSIVPFLPSREARILEIGCSTGGLLALLLRDGFPNVEGLDPSPACARAAERLHGIVVRVGTLSESSAVSGGADVVILVGVFEHVLDLGAAVERVRALCSPSGRVYVEVPDATGFADCIDAPFQQFSMEHVGYFSVGTLDALMARHGFRTLSCVRTARAHTPTSRMPVVCGVFERDGDDAAPSTRPRDRSTADGLAAYVARSRQVESRLLASVDRLVDSREPVLVWGLGTLTRRLLATSRLGQANIRAFVDSNPHYQGKAVDGVPVIGPEAVPSRAETIVIASWVFQDEIERQIRDGLLCRNDVIRLAAGERGVAAPGPGHPPRSSA